MTERHPALHDPHLEDVAVRHLFEGSPTAGVTTGCPVGATIGTPQLHRLSQVGGLT